MIKRRKLEKIEPNPGLYLSEIDRKLFEFTPSKTYEYYRNEFRFKANIVTILFSLAFFNLLLSSVVYVSTLDPNSYITTQSGQVVNITPYLIENL